MSNQNGTSTLSIIGIILAVLAIVFGFIPCLGVFAFIPGLIALIIGGIALAQAKDSGASKGLPITILIVALIGCLASAYQIYTIYSISKDVTADVKQYDNCEELERDMNALVKRLEEMDENEEDISSIGEVMNTTIKLAQLGSQSEKLGCDIEIDGKKDAEDSESETESEVDTLE